MLVILNACTFERSRLRTRTTFELLPALATSNTYVPAGNVTPGSCTLRLNVKYVARRVSNVADAADVASTPSRTTPHNMWTIFRANILSSSELLRVGTVPSALL